MAAPVELWMPIDGIYRAALSIPVNTCQRFSVHPLSWLRYLGFTIYGTEGHISITPNGLEIDYYQPDIQPGIYYYVSLGELFLLDPDLMDDRTSDASSLSDDRANFRQRVADRDRACVITGTPNFQACHIIPHTKGSKYMNNLVNHRHKVLEPPLKDINDTRNGILLAVQVHNLFGASEVAFLQTPNFAMTVNDVDLVMQPTADHLGFVTHPSLASSRLTFQHFNNHDIVTTVVAPHNSDARQSDSHEWPPPLLFDVAYGNAALKTWGLPLFVDLIRERTQAIYYNDNDNGNGGGGGGRGRGGGHGCGHGDDNGRSKKRLQQKHDCDEPAVRREEKRRIDRQASKVVESQTPDFFDILLALRMHNARKGQRQARAIKAEKTREKVQKWLDSTKD